MSSGVGTFTPRGAAGMRFALVISTITSFACGIGSGSIAHARAPETAGGQAPQLIPATPPQDAALEARLRGIFEQMDGLEGVRVRVRQGVVHLDGTTDSSSLEEHATTMAERLEGVVHVRNDITQPPSRWGPLASSGRTLMRLGRSVVGALPDLALAVVVFLPFIALSSLVRRWRHPFRAFGMSLLTGSILRVAVRAALLVAGTLAVLDVLGIMAAVGAVVGALGVLGIVAGFVFKDWVSIYLPGLMLGLRPPFKAGDLVRIGRREGRVVRITPSTTVLMTTDGEEVRIPNIEIFRGTLVNFSQHRTRRLRFRLALASEADLALTEELARRAMLGVRAIKDRPPPFMRVQVLGREEMEVEFFAWVEQDEANFRNVESRAKRAVIETLRENRVPLSVGTIVVRREAPPPTGAEARDGGSPAKTEAEEGDGAESADRAFLEMEFEQVRRRRTERDLLEEGQRPASKSRA